MNGVLTKCLVFIACLCFVGSIVGIFVWNLWGVKVYRKKHMCQINMTKHGQRDCGFGHCENIRDSWKCICRAGYINPNGDITAPCVDPCDSIDCGDGMCRILNESYACRCFVGFKNNGTQSSPCVPDHPK